MKTNQAIAATVIVATTVLTGCAGPYYQPAASQPYPATARSYSSSYGMIESIQVVQAGTGSGIGAGAVVGGLVGGILGNQVGSGTGRTAATAAGVVGGAIVGNQMEQSRKARDMYQIGVRLDNGSHQTITQDSITDLRIGDRVRIENDHAYRY